jgi:hypothetical protein
VHDVTAEQEKFRQEIRELIEESAIPIDFEALEAQGFLTPEGSWYRLHRFEELPLHASRKIKTIKQDGKGILVKFQSEQLYQALLDKLR